MVGSAGRTKRKLLVAVLLPLFLITGAKGICLEQTRKPVARFIDFYIAAEQADAPRMSLWERVIYGIAVAKTPERRSAPESACR